MILDKDLCACATCAECCGCETYDKGYEKGRAEERERIINELENRIAEETLGRNVSDVGIGLKIALKIVRGGENE